MILEDKPQIKLVLFVSPHVVEINRFNTDLWYRQENQDKISYIYQPFKHNFVNKNTYCSCNLLVLRANVNDDNFSNEDVNGLHNRAAFGV